MSSLYYAVGDVHGRDDLLAALHERIVADRRFRYPDVAATVVHIGDYVDRGTDSKGVLNRLMGGLEGFDVVCLKGNHEDFLLACLESDDPQLWRTWLGNGGDATLRSFGISLRFGRYDPVQLAHALGQDRIDWLHTLPLYHRTERYLFVHAGITPGRPIEQQEEKDLLWIRHRFLDDERDHGLRVIHGHTPSFEPELRPNRIGIDTGAVLYGRLTAVVLYEAEAPRFLTVDGDEA